MTADSSPDLLTSAVASAVVPRPYTRRRGGATHAPVLRRFWQKVHVTPTCWVWLGAVNDSGYPVFWDGRRLGYAHRVAFEMFVGPVPDGKELDHRCSVALCVRPEHLEPVTHLENVQRAWHRRRTASPAPGR